MWLSLRWVIKRLVILTVFALICTDLFNDVLYTHVGPLHQPQTRRDLRDDREAVAWNQKDWTFWSTPQRPAQLVPSDHISICSPNISFCSPVTVVITINLLCKSFQKCSRLPPPFSSVPDPLSSLHVQDNTGKPAGRHSSSGSWGRGSI